MPMREEVVEVEVGNDQRGRVITGGGSQQANDSMCISANKQRKIYDFYRSGKLNQQKL